MSSNRRGDVLLDRETGELWIVTAVGGFVYIECVDHGGQHTNGICESAIGTDSYHTYLNTTARVRASKAK